MKVFFWRRSFQLGFQLGFQSGFPYSAANKKFSKVFTRKVERLTDDKVKVIIIWSTRKIQSLFNNKDKVKHHSCVIYRRICLCDAVYTGEAIRNSEIRRNEHITGKDISQDCVKHLNDDFDYEFRWFVLSPASKNCLKRKILEAYYIKTCNPSLNNQINRDLLNLSRNGVA